MRKKLIAIILILTAVAVTLSGCVDTPHYKNVYAVFVSDGKVYTKVAADDNGSVTLPKQPTKDKYIFGGWYLDKDVWQQPFTQQTEVKQDVKVYAKWDEAPKPVAKVVILSGQSNMYGSGEVADITAQSVGQARFDKLNNPINNVKITLECGENMDMFRPVHLGVGHVGSDYFGPELGLAEYFAEKCPNETIYVVKYALSGTRLWDTWVSPSRTDRDATDKYYAMEKLIDNALQVLMDAGYDPKIIGFCWMQGESDTVVEEAFLSYYDNQCALAHDLRKRYDKYSLNGKMNFADATVGQYWTFGGFVNEAKKRFSNDDTLHNFLLDTQAPNLMQEGVNGLTFHDDCIHYDSMSVLKLGQMFAERLFAAANPSA